MPATLAVLAILVMAAPARSDVIYLKSGGVVEGFVQERFDGKVHILTSGGVIVLREEDIDESRAASPADSAYSSVKVYVEAGQLLSAARSLRAMLDREPPPDAGEIVRVKELLVSRGGRLSQSLERSDPSEGEAFIELMEELAAEPWTRTGANGRGATHLDGRFLVQIAAWQHALGYPDEAMATLGRLGGAASGIDTATRERATYLLVGMTKRQLDRSDLDGLTAALDGLQKVAPGVGRALGAWAWSQVARRYAAIGDFRRALEIYRDELLSSTPALARHRMEQVLDAAFDQLFGLRRYEELIELYEEFGTPFILGRIERRYVKSLEAAGLEALDSGKPEEAHLHFEKIRLVQREDAEDLLDLAEFERRRIELSPNDVVGRYRLALWAAERKLYDRARLLQRSLLDHPELAESARLQIQLIDRTEALELFDEMTSAAESGRYVEAIDLAEDYMDRFQLSRQRQQVRELRNAAVRDLTRQQSERPLRALSLYDEAERLHNLQQYAASLAMLDRVVIEYGDTPAGDKARKLKIGVLSELYREEAGEGGHRASIAALRQIFPSPAEADSLAQSDLRDEILSLTDTLRPYLPILHGSSPTP